MDKYKLLMMGDVPLAPSGVGTQTKYIVEHLVETGKFQMICLGGAIKHHNYEPFKVKEWGDNVVIVPVDGYGTKDVIRQALDIEKPDAIWFITDPRYYTWLWEMEDEIHQQCPLLYWHVWDNADSETWPKYNLEYYKSTDYIGCINKLTHDFLLEAGLGDRAEYIPHGVPKDDFTILSKDAIRLAKKAHLNASEDAFVVFYNSRNALRKRTGNVMYAFKEFLDMIPEPERKNCFLCMHTPPKDPEGQDLFALIDRLGLKGRVAISEKHVENKIMAEFYNIADATISLSSEEGFGLSILESLMCGTPVICTKTGGMQDQALDLETGEEFGFCLEPDARSLIGSQQTPYIWSDHVDPTTAANAINEIYQRKMASGDHKEHWAGEKARESMLRRFNLEDIQKKWEDVIVREIHKFKERNTSRSKVRMVAL